MLLQFIPSIDNVVDYEIYKDYKLIKKVDFNSSETQTVTICDDKPFTLTLIPVYIKVNKKWYMRIVGAIKTIIITISVWFYFAISRGEGKKLDFCEMLSVFCERKIKVLPKKESMIVIGLSRSRIKNHKNIYKTVPIVKSYINAKLCCEEEKPMYNISYIKSCFFSYISIFIVSSVCLWCVMLLLFLLSIKKNNLLSLIIIVLLFGISLWLLKIPIQKARKVYEEYRTVTQVKTGDGVKPLKRRDF